MYKSYVTDYPIVSIEDPFDQDDWEHYAKLTAEVGQQVQIVGDDLLVTNPKVCYINLKSVTYVLQICIIDNVLSIINSVAGGESNQGEGLQCPSVEGKLTFAFFSSARRSKVKVPCLLAIF